MVVGYTKSEDGRITFRCSDCGAEWNFGKGCLDKCDADKLAEEFNQNHKHTGGDSVEERQFERVIFIADVTAECSYCGRSWQLEVVQIEDPKQNEVFTVRTRCVCGHIAEGRAKTQEDDNHN